MNLEKLILVDPNQGLCKCLKTHFADFSGVEVVNGFFEELPAFDCLVTAANSFGLMDGGVDLAATRFFGGNLESLVQKYILEHFLGEQPLGTSIILETGSDKHPFIAHTPTMRFPMSIATTDMVYNAMWAMLLSVREHNRNQQRQIRIVACPGLGTATGKMPPEEAARQMALAYHHYIAPPTALDWRFANERQRAIGRGGDMDN